MTQRTDTELITLFNPALTEQYSNAKSFMTLAPKACFVEIRQLLERVVLDVADSFNLDTRHQSLFENIDSLKTSRFISSDLTDCMHEIRISLNPYLHYQKEDEVTKDAESNELKILAESNLKKFCELISRLRLTLSGQKDSSYTFEPDNSADLMKLTHKGIFGEDPQDRYRLARLLREIIGSKSRSFYIASVEIQQTLYHRLLETAARLDKLPEAEADYTALQLHGSYVLNWEEVKFPEKLLEETTEWWTRKDMGAALSVVVSRAVLTDKIPGFSPSKRQIKYALTQLNNAAELRYPAALSALGDVYQNGDYIEQDLDQAYALYQEAAAQSDPDGLVVFGLLLMQRKDYENARIQLEKALKEQSHIAHRCLGKLAVLERKWEEALFHYGDYLAKPSWVGKIEFVEAKLEQTEILIKVGNTEPVLHGLNELWRLQQLNNDIKKAPDLLTKCRQLTIEALKKVKKDVTPSMVQENPALYLSFTKSGRVRTMNELEPILLGIETTKDLYFSFRHIPSRQVSKKRPGRNDLCPCRSGEKYKKCCARKLAAPDLRAVFHKNQH